MFSKIFSFHIIVLYFYLPKLCNILNLYRPHSSLKEKGKNVIAFVIQTWNWNTSKQHVRKRYFLFIIFLIANHFRKRGKEKR